MTNFLMVYCFKKYFKTCLDFQIIKNKIFLRSMIFFFSFLESKTQIFGEDWKRSINSYIQVALAYWKLNNFTDTPSLSTP